MNVLSLFDGVSCGQVALERAGIQYDNYFASENNVAAMQVTQANYPKTIQLGDVRLVKGKHLPEIDLLIGGSPCQGFSVAGRRLNFDDPRSALFFEYVRVIREVKPKHFLLENVVMKQEWVSIISEHVGVEPIKINSALVSAQQRKRLYWTNIPNIAQPEDKGIFLKDIIDDGYTERLKSYCICATYGRAVPQDYFLKNQRQLIFTKPIRVGHIGKGAQGQRIYSIDGKAIAVLSNNTGGQGSKSGLYEIGKYVRKLTPLECERLQTLPDGYTETMPSNNQRYKALGNCFTVDVIAHILRQI